MKGNPRIRTHLAMLILIGCVGGLMSGCSKVSTTYGQTKGYDARTSLNGFAALRQAYDQAGYRQRDVNRLTDRVKRADVIVWTPQVYGTVSQKVGNWFEAWLKSGEKTLIYVVPDGGSEADYWIEAGQMASPEQRIEYRKRAARSVNDRVMWRLNRNVVMDNGWFRVEPLDYRVPLGSVASEWSDVIADSPDRIAPAAIEYELLPTGSSSKKKKTPPAAPATTATGNSTPATPPNGTAPPTKPVAKPPANPAVVADDGPTGPTSPGWGAFEAQGRSRTDVQFDPVVNAEDGSVAVAVIRSQQWKDSKIIVIAGGSLVTNYALTHPINQSIAEEIIARSRPKGIETPLAGFLTSNWMPISVSQRQDGVPVAAGAELMVWPLSLVTMHGALLGLILCLMLIPIFGRPRKIQTGNHSNFSDHLDAVAALMSRSGGEAFARGRISEYFKRVRGETSGPWIQAEPLQTVRAAAPLPKLRKDRPTPTSNQTQPSQIQPSQTQPDATSREQP